MKTKLAILVTRSDTFGGVHAHIVNLIESLSANEFDICLITGPSENNHFLKRVPLNSSLTYYICPYLKRNISLIDDLKSLAWLISFLLRNKIKLLSIHSSKSGLVGRIAGTLTRVKHVFTIHGWPFESAKNKYSRFAYVCIEHFMRLFTDHVVFVCEYDLNVSRKYHLNYKNSLLIYNTTTITPSIIPKTVSKNISFLMVARFDYQKDHRTLLHAFSKLKSYFSNWNLVLVGHGPTLNFYQNLAHELNISAHVSFEGYHEDVSKFYANSNIYVLSSNWEGFPITSLEAMSCSLPVIVTDVCGAKECIISGYNGYYFPRQDTTKLFEILTYYMNNISTISVQGKAASFVFNKNFSYAHFKNAYNALFSEILS